MRQLLDVFVPGWPAPKGSMDVMPNGRLTQNNVRSEAWAHTVADAARECVAVLPGRPGAWVWHEGYPYAGPVSVWLEFRFQRPVEPRFDVPGTTATGDVDKLVRNVLDALTVAKVWADDALVVDLHATSRYATVSQESGVDIQVYQVTETPSFLSDVRTFWLDMVRYWKTVRDMGVNDLK